MIHVVHAELDALVPSNSLAAMDLRPTRNAGTDVEHSSLLGGVVLNRPRMVGQGRTGADKGHIPLQDVDSLRKLVQAGRPEETAHTSDTGIPPVGVHPLPHALGIHAHTAELVHAKHAASPSQPLLLEQNGALGVHLDGNGDQKIQGERHKKDEDGQQNIQYPLEKMLIHTKSSFL